MSALTATLVPGASTQLSATARDRSGNALSRTLAWSTSDPAKATVSSSGMVAGVAPGTATITAAVDGKSATSTVTILDGGVVSSAGATLDLRSGEVQIVVPPDALASSTNLSVIPSTAYVNDTRVVKNTPFDFGPTGTAFAKPVRIKIKYLTSDLPEGTEEPALQVHLATPTGWRPVEGSVVDLSAKTVTADVSHFSVYAILTPLPVTAVTIQPPADKPFVDGVSTLIVGDTEQLTATPTDALGATLPNRAVTWATSNGAIATVTTGGLVSAISAGTATISATVGGVTSSIKITVTPVPVAAVAVTLATGSILVGQTSQATAVVSDAGGHVLTGRAITWSSSDPGIATVSATGVVTAVLPGTASITAASELKTGSASINVDAVPVASVNVTLASSSIVLGQTTQAMATTLDGSGNILTGRVVNWASENPSVATVSSTGLVTAVAVGTANIIATSETKTGTTTLAVTAVPVASVVVDPPSANLSVGSTQQLTATTKDGTGAVLGGRTVIWASTNDAIASVDANGLVTAHAIGAATINAVSEGKTGTSSITVVPVPVASVTVSLTSNSITAVETTHATASTLDANGGALTGRTITWSSSNTAIATVSADGVVTAVAVGTANIIAASEGKTGSATLTVTPAPVASIALNPPSVTLVDGATQQLTATLEDAHHNLLTGRVIDWSTDNHDVATVSASGLVSAVGPGVATIAAVSEGTFATAKVTVTPIPVATVSVSLASSSVVAGQTTQATATILDGSGNTLTGRVVTWASDDPAATVSATGLVTAVAAGTAHIIATSETRTGQATLTVTPVPVASVTVDPTTARVIVGSTQQFTATTKDGNGTTLAGRGVDWSSNNPSVASIDANGLVTAHAIGSATINATSEGKSGTSSVTVIPVPVSSVTVSLNPVSITAVGTSQATAATLDLNGGALMGRIVTWTSGNTAVATVSASGVVTAVAEGTANIVATSEGKIGSAPINVTPAPVATVTVVPPSAVLFQGETQQMAVMLKDSRDRVLSGRTVTWSSSNPTVAAVSASGVVTAGATGPATITATSEGQSGTASITVSMVPVASVTVTLAASTINVAQNTQASATLRDAGGNILTGRSIVWTSDNNVVATVSSGGVVTALAVGTAHIIATSGGQTGSSATLTVIPIPVASVSVSLAASSIQTGQTTQATATTLDANNNPLSGRVVGWSSGNTGVATVSSSGVVTAVAVGTTSIIATSEGVPGSASVTVVPVPVASLTLSAPVTPVILGQAQQLTAIPKDGSGNALTGRTVNWVSSSQAVLSLSASSSVSTSTGATITVIAAEVGTATITATSEAASGISTPVITVNPIPVASVTVSPASATLVFGITPTQQLTAVTKAGDGSVLTGRVVTWSSSNPATATVDANGFVTAVGGGATTITATSENKTGTSSITVTVPVVTVVVTPSSVTLPVSATHQLAATTNDANGNPLSGRVVAWSSNASGVASVTTSGLVTAVSPGSATITATSEGKSGTSSITITPIPVASVSVSLAATTIQVGQTTQATATTFDSTNNPLTGRAVTWSAGNSAVAIVSGSGVVTAVGPGSTTVVATSEGKSGNAGLTVIPVPVASVSVNPPSASLIVGATQQLSAETRDAISQLLTGRLVTWSSSNPAVATVSATGIVNAVSAGGATITATSEGKNGISAITVVPVPVASVTVALSPNPITAVGTSQATATTFDASGGVLTGRAVAWSSSNTGVATISAQGVISAIAAGTTSIVATSEGKSGPATLTVTPAPVASVTVIPPSAIVFQGETEQLSVTLKDAHDNVLTGRTVTWSSSNPSIASVSTTGLVTAIVPGAATITATSESQSGSSSITVSLVPIATVSVALGSSTITDAQSTQATATLRDADGNVLTGRSITWSADNSAVAVVSPTGVVTPVAPGSTQIRATSGGQTGAAPLTVMASVSTVIVTPPSANVVVGTTLQLAAETRDASNNVLTGRSVSWSSSNASIAGVSATGLVTANALGSVTITATSEGKSGASAITVVQIPVTLVTVSLAATTITVGQTTQATAITRDAVGTILTGRTITWSTGNAAIATVSSGGVVTAVSAGTVQVTAMSEGKTGSATLTVNPTPVATLVLSVAATPMIVGGTQVLTAQPKDAGGNTLSGRTVNWVSSNTGVLTVSAATSVSTPGGATITVAAVGLGTATISATSESAPGATTPTITVNPVPVATVTVSPPTANLVVGISPTQQLTAVTKDVSGNVLTGRLVTWTSGNTAAATVSATGLVTTAGAGTATITATSEGKTGTSSITVSLAPVVTLTVSAPTTPMIVGGTQQLTATARDANGNVLTGRTVTWASSNGSVLTVSSTGSPATVTAIGVGAATITATSESVSSTPTPSITVNPVPVATVTVSPATATLVLGITPTQQFTAVTKDANGNVLAGRLVAWTSSNTAAATVDATGLVTAVGAGSTTITATSEGKSGPSAVTVSLAPVSAVTVSAPTTPMIVGQTQQVTATTRDANGNLVTGRVISWVSSNNAVLTVSANGTPATVTAVAPGTATITATSESVASSPTPAITVNPVPVATVTVTPATATLVLGITPTQQLTAVTKDGSGNVLSGRVVTWSSSNTTAASVSTTGLVTAVGAGSTTITASSEGHGGTAAITVSVAPVASVSVSLVPTSITAVGTSQATATTRDANGNTLTGRSVTWVSGNTAIATVDAQGLVTAVATGTAIITASSEGQSGGATITVTPAPVASVTVSAPTTPMIVGGTQQLTAVTKDVNGNPLTGRVISWVSSNNAVLTVSANGSPATVTAVGVGAATITATSESVSSSPTPAITVNPAPVASVTVTPATATLVLGITPTQQLTAVTKDTNGNVLNGRTVAWASSNTTAATVDGTGLVTAIAAGATTITATSEGQIGSSAITVTVAPVTTVTVSTPTTPVIVGATQDLTATPKDANGNILSGRTVTWVSSDPAVLTISSASSVSTATGAVITATAAGVGTATITATSESAPPATTTVITVSPVPVATVTVNPPTANLVLGITPTQQLTAVTKDGNDNVLTGRLVTWSSSNAAAATTDANGLVTAVAAGNATITATSEGQNGTSSIAVTIAPVATVTVSAPTTPMVVGGTQQLTAVTKDANDHVLTGRTITWASSNTAILTVSASGSLATVTAVGVGTAAITATSESVSSGPTPTITVNPAPVQTVILSIPSTPMTIGGTQVLTATPKDANGNNLSGRTVNWASSNSAVLTVSVPSSVSTSSGATVTLTAVGPGTATITATSESAPGATTSGITVDLPPTTATLLRRSATNPRYFENANGQIVYLTGSHTWSNLQDNGTVDPPPAFNYSAYLDFLEAHNHNFFRLWAWEQSKWTAEIAADYWITPGPFKRTGPGAALDGKPKFDLSQFNQAYFDRLRSRVLDARARGIYVSVMLFDGWSVGTKGSHTLNNPWGGHPFNAANNINGIDGDTDGDGNGLETQTLPNVVTGFQEAYVRRVIDAVNDLDNVLYEIDNEGDPSSKDWQYHIIQIIRDYEATKAKQHPIGMTPMYPGGVDSDLFGSNADWISITGDADAPITATGAKVLISDTDHLCGICGTVSWIWKSFVKGQNPILMDGYDGAATGLGAAGYTSSDPIWNQLRNNMGYARSYALRMNLATAVPHGDKVMEINGQFVPTGYCLATPGSQYLVFIPGGGNVRLNLSEVTGTLTVEWFNPATGVATPGGTVSGGPSQTLTAPFGGNAVLFLH